MLPRPFSLAFSLAALAGVSCLRLKVIPSAGTSVPSLAAFSCLRLKVIDRRRDLSLAIVVDVLSGEGTDCFAIGQFAVLTTPLFKEIYVVWSANYPSASAPI